MRLRALHLLTRNLPVVIKVVKELLFKLSDDLIDNNQLSVRICYPLVYLPVFSNVAGGGVDGGSIMGAVWGLRNVQTVTGFV